MRPQPEIDKLFDEVDTSGDGLIDFEEMKHSLNCWLKKSKAKRRGSVDKYKPTPLGAGPYRASEFYGGEREFHPKEGPHTHTVIVIRPASALGPLPTGGFTQAYQHLRHHVRFVFVCAPLRTVTGPNGVITSTYTWFTPVQPNKEFDAAVAEAQEEIRTQTQRLHAIFDREATRLNGDTSKIVLCGSGQGGSVALHAAVEYHSRLCALVCLRSSIFDDFTIVTAGDVGLPIFLFAAEEVRAP